MLSRPAATDLVELDYTVSPINALAESHRKWCPRAASDPFTLVNRVCGEVHLGSAVVVHVHGLVNSIAIAHLMTMWRECVSRGGLFRTVLMETKSLAVLRSVGLAGTLDAQACPADLKRSPGDRDNPVCRTCKNMEFDSDAALAHCEAALAH